ncbi:MAG: hypothetical protein FJ306_04975, partial [Planctomycetes bacterium]|nr:hypothetical protein [Planctomycetota bacterium]
GAELTAWVEASPWTLRQHTDALAASARPWRARIGADGDFAVDALPPDGALLLVAEDGQGRRWCSAPAPGDPAATWRFAPGMLAVETSLDTAGGEVVATHTTGFRVVAPLVSGRARLSALPPGAYEVSCRTDRGTVLRARAAVDGCAVCLLRTDGLRHLAGTVVDATGAAVAGAIVEVSAGVDRATTGATATDADGRFTVVVTAAEHALVRWRGQTHRFAVADRREPLRLALAPRRTVRGRLLDRDGAGAEALLTTLWNDGGWLDPAERATVVAADGSFALNDVPKGRLAVGFHTPEGVFYRADVGEGADLGAIAPRLPRALRVRVRDAAGRPVAAPLHVDASPSFVLAGGASALVSGVAPDSDGAIVVPVPCWIERLHVHTADRSATAAIGVGEVVAAGASGAEIRLQPVGRIAGATSKREPSERWLVVADEAASDAPRVVWAPAQGDFAVDGLRPGCYRLDEWRRGSEHPLCRHRVRLAAAATAEVDAPPARSLRVAIDGLPDGATVSIGVDDAIATTIANRTSHDVCLPAGEHVVTCRAASGERLGLSRRVVIATSGADVDLAFRLPGGRLFGCAPSAFATSAIQVLPHAPSWLPATLSPDADGRFLLAHVDPNACTLYCVASDGGAAAVAPAATGEWRCVATARVHWPIGAEGEPLCVRSLDGMPLPLRCEGPVAAVPCGAIVAGWRGRQARFVARPGGVVMLD